MHSIFFCGTDIGNRFNFLLNKFASFFNQGRVIVCPLISCSIFFSSYRNRCNRTKGNSESSIFESKDNEINLSKIFSFISTKFNESRLPCLPGEGIETPVTISPFSIAVLREAINQFSAGILLSPFGPAVIIVAL